MKKSLDPKLPIPKLGNGDTPDPAVKPDGYQDRLNRRLFELFKEFDDGTVAVYDEGVYLGQADGLNFIGDAVTATSSSTLPTGIFDITVTASAGAGTTLDTLFVTASEDVAAGDLINIFSASGVFKGRKAKASASGYEAYGWTDSAVLSGSTITVRFLGKNTHSSGLTPGPVFLSDTAGLATSTCPTGSGHVAQQVGVADSASEFAFEWQPAVLLAATHSISSGGGVSTSIEVTTTTTVQIPVGGAWLTMIGGGGGGFTSTSTAGGGGGGAGEYCQNFLVPISAGETVTVTIGAGGTAGSDGGTTSFACTAGTFSVLGGKGAPSGTGGAGGGPRGSSGGGAGSSPTAGGLGTAESPVHFGGSSGGGGNSSTTAGASGGGAPGLLSGGAGGSGSGSNGGGGGGAASIWGAGGAGGAGGAVGSDAASTAYGAGGGGGGGGTHAGGKGAPGYVLIVYVA